MSDRNGVISVVKCGKESEFKWKVNNFSLNANYYSSPHFKFEGESWWLYLNPNGTDGYMRMFLWRSSSAGSPIQVEFSVSVETTEGRKNFERRYRKRFEGLDCSYEIPRWISKSEFRNRQREFLFSSFGFLSQFFWSECFTILIKMKREESGESESASAEASASCSKDSLGGDKMSLDRSFLDKLVKCPQCDEVLKLKKWLDHECQMTNAKAATSTRSCVTCDHDKILQDLNQLLLNQEQTDIILRVKGEEFPAHKAILVARSSVFASTFRHDMKERKTGIVDIEDCDPSVFPDFLRFLYSNDTDNLSRENAFGLFTIADKYNCQDFRAKCVEFIKKNLTVEVFCKALALALIHSEAELLRVATDFFIENADKILVTVEWQRFAAENLTYCNELFIKYVNSTKRSNR